MSELLTEEKIDYIYKEIRRQKRGRYASLFIKIAMVLFVIYGYYKIIPLLDTSKYADNFADKITKIVQPITEKIVESMVNKQSGVDEKLL